MIGLLFALDATAAPPGVSIAPAAPAVVWIDGDVRIDVVDEAGEVVGSGSVAVGDALGAGSSVEIPEDGLLALVIGGVALLRQRGPATVTSDGATVDVTGTDAPAALVPLGYAEPAGLAVAIRESLEPDVAPKIGLRFASPQATALTSNNPALSWEFDEDDAAARFDLAIEVAEAADRYSVVESWRGLAGRATHLWAPLARGRGYRATVRLHGDAAIGAATEDVVAFRILSVAEQRALDAGLAALDALERDPPSPRPELAVLRARLYEGLGLTVEAAADYVALAHRYPERLSLWPHVFRLRAAFNRHPGR